MTNNFSEFVAKYDKEGRENPGKVTQFCKDLEMAIEGDGAMVVGHDWKPTAYNINKLPEPLRDYLHELHTGEASQAIQDLAVQKDNCKYLAGRLTEYRRELLDANKRLNNNYKLLAAIMGDPVAWMHLLAVNNLLNKYGSTPPWREVESERGLRRLPMD